MKNYKKILTIIMSLCLVSSNVMAKFLITNNVEEDVDQSVEYNRNEFLGAVVKALGAEEKYLDWGVTPSAGNLPNHIITNYGTGAQLLFGGNGISFELTALNNRGIAGAVSESPRKILTIKNDIKKLQARLSKNANLENLGTLDANGGTLVTDKQVKDYVDGKFLKKDLSNYTDDDVITDDNAKKFAEKVAKATNDDIQGEPKGYLVTDAQVKANFALVNLSNVSNLNPQQQKVFSTKIASSSSLEAPKDVVITDTKVKAGLDLKANKSDLAVLTGRVTTNEANITNLTTKVDKNVTDISNITTKVDKNVTDISNLSSTVTNLTQTIDNGLLKTDLSNLGNVTSDTAEKVAEKLSNGADISNPTGKLVTDTQVKTALDKINAVGNGLQKEIDSNKGGIASAIAAANIPQVAGDKLFSVGVGVSYYDKHGAIALGISGQDKGRNIVYKVTTGVDFKGSFNVGAGINYSFGKTKYSGTLTSKDLERVENLTVKLNKQVSLNDKLQSNIKEQNEDIAMLKEQIKELKSLVGNKGVALAVEQNYSISGFGVGHYKLTNKQKNELDKIISQINGREITLIGYTDTKGNDKFNLSLGLDRANEVYKYMISKGVKSENINIKSRGYSEITNQNASKLRRVEIIVK